MRCREVTINKSVPELDSLSVDLSSTASPGMTVAPGFAHAGALLLVDSDDDSRRMYAEFLKPSFHRIDEASDGRDGLVQALARPHDAIVTDTHLPGISGYALCELLRRDHATRTTPLVVMTSDAFPSRIDQAILAGVDVVLVKPCLPAMLLEDLQSLIARSRDLRRRSSAVNARVVDEPTLSRSLQVRSQSIQQRVAWHVANSHAAAAPQPMVQCPDCHRTLTYSHSHSSGPSLTRTEQWDYFTCTSGCGTFQYRQRTRKIRRVS